MIPSERTSRIQPEREALEQSISATMENGRKLLDDARLLSDWDRFPTAFALAILAQEEFAKSFLLQLVADEALPWLPEVQRSMAWHDCKHLLAIVLEWLPTYDWENMLEQHRLQTLKHEHKMAWLQRRLDRYKQGNFDPDPNDPKPMEPEVSFPSDIETALQTYHHHATGKVRSIAGGSVDGRSNRRCTLT